MGQSELQILVNGVDNFSKTLESGVDSLGSKIGGLGGTIAKSLGVTAVGGFTAIAGATVAGAVAFGLYAKEATMVAARVDEMRIVNEVLAANLGISNELVRDQVNGLRSQGIEAGFAEDAIAKMMRAQLDLADATNLASVAQNSAVISGQNSSETFDQLIHGITTINPLVLRNAGVIVSAEAAFDAYAETIGKTASELSGAEKQAAMLHAVLESGETIAGAYDAAMTNPVKQLGSLKRLFNDIAVNVGDRFLPGFSGVIAEFSGFVKWVIAATAEGGTFAPLLDLIAGGFSNIGGSIGPALELLKTFSEVGSEALTALLSGDMDGFTDVFGDIADLLMEIVSSNLSGFVDAGLNILQTFTGAIINAIPLLVPVAIRIMTELVSGLLNAIPMILEAIIVILEALITGIAEFIPLLVDIIKEVVPKIVSVLVEHAPLMIEAAVSLITNLIVGILELLPVIIMAGINLLVGLIDGLLSALPVLIAAAPAILDALINAITTALPMLITAAIGIITTLATAIVELLPNIIEVAIQLLMTIINTIVALLPELIPLALQLIIALVQALAELLPLIYASGIEILISLITGLVAALPDLVAMVPEIIIAIIETLTTLLPDIMLAGVDILMTLIEGIITIIPVLIEAVPVIITALIDAFVKAWPQLKQAGIDLITGLWEGIKQMWADMLISFGDIVDKLPIWLKSLLGISSPSKVFMEIGTHIPEGLAAGIKATMDLPGDQIEEMSKALSFTLDTTPRTLLGEGNTYNYNLTMPTSNRPEEVGMAFHLMRALGAV